MAHNTAGSTETAPYLEMFEVS